MQANEARTSQGVYIWVNGALVYLTTVNGTPRHRMADDDEDWDEDEWDDDEDWDEDEDDDWDEDENDEDEDQDWDDDDDWDEEDEAMVRGRVEPIRRRALALEPRRSKPSRHRPRVRQQETDDFDAYTDDD